MEGRRGNTRSLSKYCESSKGQVFRMESRCYDKSSEREVVIAPVLRFAAASFQQKFRKKVKQKPTLLSPE